jgi:hypothetical protein
MTINKRIGWMAFVLLPIWVTAQTMTDGIFMPKKAFCGGVMLTQDRFDQYWEGTTLRSNANMGTMSMTATGVMGNYGVTDRLNIIASLPYVTTKANAGVMAGMAGIQDLTVALKYNALKINHFDFIASVGGSLPLSDYAAAYPLAIGTRSKSVFGRGIVHYLHPKGWTMTAQAAYILRGNITIDQSNYYTDRNIFSNEVRMDNVFQAGVRGGFYTYRWAAELMLDRSAVQGGFDIRRNDMMFPANRQESTRLGLIAFYRVKSLRDLQVVGTAAYTLAGRNVGKALSFGGGLMMAFNYKK